MTKTLPKPARSLQSAKAQLAILEHDIAETVLIAPCDGVVRSRLLEPGDMASPQRAVYLVALTSPKWIRAYVPETQLGLIHEGMRLLVTTDNLAGRTHDRDSRVHCLRCGIHAQDGADRRAAHRAAL